MHTKVVYREYGSTYLGNAVTNSLQWRPSRIVDKRTYTVFVELEKADNVSREELWKIVDE